MNMIKSQKTGGNFVVSLSRTLDTMRTLLCHLLVSQEESEFEVDEGATKAKIKSAFVKSLKTKKLNKKVLGEFISLVA